jgi:NDP-sugar pyrophosphorylase family protein
VIPKPLVPIGDRPVLEHIICSLARSGVDQIDLCVSHLGSLIHLYLSQIELPPGLRVAFHSECEPLGTAGALRSVPDLSGTFIVMNGDILTTLDYRALVEHHEQHGAALTVAMRSERVEIQLGVIHSDADGFVQGYIEKPALLYDVSMGVYVYSERALRYLPDGVCQFPDLVLRMLAADEQVSAFHSDADWYDIGTLSEYERAAADFERFPGKYGVDAVPSAFRGPHILGRRNGATPEPAAAATGSTDGRA